MIIIGGIRGAAPRRNVVVAGTALALAMVPLASAWAGVKYATSTSACTKHGVAGPNDPLSVMAGANIQFEVWGDSVDLVNPTTGFTFTGPSGMQATVVSQSSGLRNFQRGCDFLGSAVVQVTTPGTMTSNASASVSFQMPLGDFSSLALTIVPFPALAQATWSTSGSLHGNLPCIVKTGSISLLNKDTKLVIQLPPGAAEDQTTCTYNVIDVEVLPTSPPTVDIPSRFNYTVTGLPSFLTVTQGVPENPTLIFRFNVNGIRTLTATSNSTITIQNPIATNRTTTLTLQVAPTAGQGFAQVATANPIAATAGNPIDFTLRLSAPSSGQVITWRMTQAACFRQAVPEAPYSSAATFQFFSVPDGVTSTIIRVLAAKNGGCTNNLAPTAHIFEAWAGDSRVNPQVTAVTSGAKYTRTNVSLPAP
jgi:hypothetical protein